MLTTFLIWNIQQFCCLYNIFLMILEIIRVFLSTSSPEEVTGMNIVAVSLIAGAKIWHDSPWGWLKNHAGVSWYHPGEIARTGVCYNTHRGWQHLDVASMLQRRDYDPSWFIFRRSSKNDLDGFDFTQMILCYCLIILCMRTWYPRNENHFHLTDFKEISMTVWVMCESTSEGIMLLPWRFHKYSRLSLSFIRW